jgi:predicted RNase H-like HicB family nuclease
MLNLTYLAVLEQGEDGGYGISFPDLPGCFSCSDDLASAPAMAAEAAELHIYGMTMDGESIPKPSVSLPKELTEGNIIMSVAVHPDIYRAKRDNERVKTNVTLPAWLKRAAEADGVNYSRLLESALTDYLQIPKQNIQ